MRLLVVASFLLAAPCLAVAQFPSDVQPGTRVRVWLPEAVRQEQPPEKRQVLRGTVESVDAGSVRLRIPGTGGALGIPRASVRRLDVTRGVSRGASAVERAVGSAVVVGVLYAVMNDPDHTSGPHFRTDWKAGGVGAAVGAGIGAIIGAIWPYERWRRVIR
jgi:hypothetical protein